MGRTQGHRRRDGAGAWLALWAMTFTTITGCGLLGDDDTTPTIDAVTVALEAIGTDTDDPFFDSVAISETTLTDDITTAAIDGILATTTNDDDTPPVVDGATPGLYGGTQDNTTCDIPRLTDYLTDPTNHDKATAFAQALGMTTADIPQVLAGYTPVTLTLDTLVTNHGYRDGTATPFPAILQAGTAVLVDATGTPRVKCSCGNPLTPPDPDTRLTTTTVTGTPWRGWNPTTTTHVTPAPAPLTDLTLTDTTTGDTYQQPVGNDGSTSDGPIDPTTVVLPANACYTEPRLTEYPSPTTHPPVQLTPSPYDDSIGSAEMADSEGNTYGVSARAGVTADVGRDGTVETILIVDCVDHRAANAHGSFIGFVTLRSGPDGTPVAVGGSVPAASRTPELSLEGDVLVEQGLTFGPSDNHADGPTSPTGSRWSWNGDGWDPAS